VNHNPAIRLEGEKFCHPKRFANNFGFVAHPQVKKDGHRQTEEWQIVLRTDRGFVTQIAALRDSLPESSVIAGFYEQPDPYGVQAP
jgi:hypothetical protein